MNDQDNLWQDDGINPREVATISSVVTRHKTKIFESDGCRLNINHVETWFGAKAGKGFMPVVSYFGSTISTGSVSVGTDLSAMENAIAEGLKMIENDKERRTSDFWVYIQKIKENRYLQWWTRMRRLFNPWSW